MPGKKNKKLVTLDLHGRRTDEVFDLVDRFLTQYAHLEQVKIMPGKGTGQVKTELLRYLKLGGYPWSYETLPNGNKNTGCLVIHLNDN